MPLQERANILAELTPGHSIFEPGEQLVPFVFCSPHSGRVYPRVLLEASRLSAHGLRKSEDCFVDELYSRIPELGAPLIAALFPRAYLDVNREPFELDPLLFGSEVPSYANTQSIRVTGGLGTVARIVADGEEIYHTPPTLAAALERVELLYRPFHADLADLLERTRLRFGIAVLIDCHSMPSAAMTQMSGSRPDMVLGDRFGSACDPKLTKLVRDQMGQLGYHVLLNRPYAGGFITEHYGRPSAGCHALQIEVNRALYMDEATLKPTRRFAKLQSDLTTVVRRIFAEFSPVIPLRTAAE
jgi:N-formylglutamate amidohydrolase